MIRKGRGCVTDLLPRRPLHRCDSVASDVRLIARSDLTAHLLTTRARVQVDGVIGLGPCDYLLVGDETSGGAAQLVEAAGAGTALVQDMTSAFVFIDVIGADVPARLGVADVDPDRGGATRLADLRVVIAPREGGLCIAAGRSHAAYLWSWLTTRLIDQGNPGVFTGT